MILIIVVINWTIELVRMEDADDETISKRVIEHFGGYESWKRFTDLEAVTL